MTGVQTCALPISSVNRSRLDLLSLSNCSLIIDLMIYSCGTDWNVVLCIRISPSLYRHLELNITFAPHVLNGTAGERSWFFFNGASRRTHPFSQRNAVRVSHTGFFALSVWMHPRAEGLPSHSDSTPA